jgi:hypothetical protein
LKFRKYLIDNGDERKRTRQVANKSKRGRPSIVDSESAARLAQNNFAASLFSVGGTANCISRERIAQWQTESRFRALLLAGWERERRQKIVRSPLPRDQLIASRAQITLIIPFRKQIKKAQFSTLFLIA